MYTNVANFLKAAVNNLVSNTIFLTGWLLELIAQSGRTAVMYFLNHLMLTETNVSELLSMDKQKERQIVVQHKSIDVSIWW